MQSQYFTNKHSPYMKSNVLITGCSTGIGRALALELNKSGFEVFATARKIESLNELKEMGINILELDINDPKSIKKCLESVKEKTTSLSMLINNAGYAEMGPLIEMPDDVLEIQFRTNVLSQISVTKTFLPLLLNNDSKVVNISSVSGDFTTPFAGAYCATKAAFSSLSDALRMELKPLGIKVITVRPGAIESNFGKTADKGVKSWLKKDSLYSKINEGIIARANASQDNPTPVSVFAQKLVKELIKKNPKRIIRLGNGSRLLNLLGKFPKSITDKILSKKFSLDKL